MEDVLIPAIVVPIMFIALPWLILHYVTKWKVNSRLTDEDETMLDDLYELARRLDDRMLTIERIIQDDNPAWNSLAHDRAAPRIERPAADDLETELRSRRTNAPDLAKRGRS